jgi:hypothetical protein
MSEDFAHGGASGKIVLNQISPTQTRHLMKTDPDSVLFPIGNLGFQFGFTVESLAQELRAGRLRSCLAGVEQVPCISGKDFLDWLRHPETPGVLREHVTKYLKAKGRPS